MLKCRILHWCLLLSTAMLSVLLFCLRGMLMLTSEQSKNTTVLWRALQKGMSELTLQFTSILHLFYIHVLYYYTYMYMYKLHVYMHCLIVCTWHCSCIITEYYTAFVWQGCSYCISFTSGDVEEIHESVCQEEGWPWPWHHCYPDEDAHWTHAKYSEVFSRLLIHYASLCYGDLHLTLN